MSAIKDEKNLEMTSTSVLPAQPGDVEVGGQTVEKHKIALADADEAAAFVAGFHGEIDPKEADRIRRKIDWHILPLMMTLYFVQFTDKTTLGSSSILGIKTDTHLTATEYNWLGTIFYLAYLIFEWPQTLGLQKFPPGKWMACNIFVWSVVLCCHAACTNFAGLFVCRFFLGVCEGSITAGFLIVTSMFYTHIEATRRVGFCPMSAYFLTQEEKIVAIERLRAHSTGIENKHWKREQFIEAITDWKPWAFAIFAAIDNLPNSLTNQSAMIINSFGFTVGQTTLLGMVSGAIEIITIYSSTLIIKKVPNSRGIVGACYFIPNIVSGIMMVSLPWTSKGGLLAAVYLGGLGTPGFVLSLSWCAATNLGHTKKTTANAMLLIGYCVGNLVAPQMWLAQYSPRYYIPWGVILASYTICPLMMLGIAWALRRENNRRDRLTATGEIKVEKFYDENGEEIDSTFLDMTDRKNLAFRYPL
ncbi:hypothetical protein EHS25_005820 [Saitozyma podzolica]|uniref:Major facilitator superfamily (MFS) profile domain-containing protein n=1 Tax=Saitozyma podzolica TaxID=1890683 RepID=A0A427XVH7_9TREE|nr:hypothetical protein EHS25_005820 [Saitozyma podzolica]